MDGAVTHGLLVHAERSLFWLAAVKVCCGDDASCDNDTFPQRGTN